MSAHPEAALQPRHPHERPVDARRLTASSRSLRLEQQLRMSARELERAPSRRQSRQIVARTREPRQLQRSARTLPVDHALAAALRDGNNFSLPSTITPCSISASTAGVATSAASIAQPSSNSARSRFATVSASGGVVAIPFALRREGAGVAAHREVFEPNRVSGGIQRHHPATEIQCARLPAPGARRLMVFAGSKVSASPPAWSCRCAATGPMRA